MFQKIDLVQNLEKLTFWASKTDKLLYAKRELMTQINNLNIFITGNDFFIINRQFLSGVSFEHFDLLLLIMY